MRTVLQRERHNATPELDLGLPVRAKSIPAFNTANLEGLVDRAIVGFFVECVAARSDEAAVARPAADDS